MKIVLITLAMLLSFSSIAAEIPVSQIKYIAPWPTHVDITMATTGIDPEGCGSKSFYRVDLVSDVGADAKVATLLAAFMAGKPVGLHIAGCVRGAPKISGVRLYK